MAAGTLIKLKRKAGAFVGGDLAAGELGVDTTNEVIYGSADGSTVFTVAAAGESPDQVYHVQDQKTNGTDGGSKSSGVDTRVLNTEVTANITGASLSSNVVTLPAGTFMVQAAAPAYKCGAHKIYLYNTSDSSIALIGSNEVAVGGTGTQTASHSFLQGVITIASSKNFELRHYSASAQATNGLGNAVSASMTEVYADLIFTKIA